MPIFFRRVLLLSMPAFFVESQEGVCLLPLWCHRYRGCWRRRLDEAEHYNTLLMMVNNGHLVLLRLSVLPLLSLFMDVLPHRVLSKMFLVSATLCAATGVSVRPPRPPPAHAARCLSVFAQLVVGSP